MKKVVCIAVLALLCASLSVMAGANGFAGKDPGFAGPIGTGGYQGGLNSGWYVNEGSTTSAGVSYSIAAGAGPDGSSCLQAIAGTAPLGRSNMMNLRNFAIPLAGGAPAVFQLDYKTAGTGWTNLSTGNDTSDPYFQLVTRAELFIIQYNGTGGMIGWPNCPPTIVLPSAGPNGWQHMVYNFTPDPTCASIQFKFLVGFSKDADPDDAFWADNISLASVPEPGTIVSLLSGVAGMGLMIIRRKRA